MAKREVDKRKTSKALRKLRRVAERAAEEGGPGLTTWEKEFVDGVTTRLETYGSAFRDPSKGRLEEALSNRQVQVTRAIDSKSRKAKAAAAGGKTDLARKKDQPRSGSNSTFKRKDPDRQKDTGKRKDPGKGLSKSPAKQRSTPRVRDINEDMPDASLPPEPPQPPPKLPVGHRPTLKIIRGGKLDGG